MYLDIMGLKHNHVKIGFFLIISGPAISQPDRAEIEKLPGQSNNRLVYISFY